MKTLIICSGGLDSSAMAIICKEKKELILMGFNYGQKGIKEIEVVKNLAIELNARFELIDLSFIKKIYGKSNQLTSSSINIEKGYFSSVVVPLRNSLFLQVAYIYAIINNIDEVVLGSHLDDIQEINGERLYPDCSPEFFKSFQLAMDLGTFRGDKKIQIISASILKMTKGDVVKKAYEVSGDLIFDCWSCYKSETKHCGECESCFNRKKAFKKIGIIDKTKYQK